MSELWTEIYNLLMERDYDAIKMQKAVDTEMERMLIPYKNKLSDEEKEKMYTFLYDVIYVAESEATLYGIKLMMRLMLEL